MSIYLPMQPRAALNKTIWLVTLFFLNSYFSSALAQPDAGTILREQQTQQGTQTPVQSPPSPEPTIAEQIDLSNAADEGPKLMVRGFRFRGNTLISSEALATQTSELVGEELSFGQLQAVGLLLTGYYAAEGYLAHFALPPQDIENGIVEYQVVEGILGDVQFLPNGTKVSSERVKAYIYAWMKEGEPLNLLMLGEAMNILNEQPGVNLTTSLEPGQRDQAINLNLIAADSPSSYAFLSTNNYSTAGTGENQASLTVGAQNLTGRFDNLVATVSGSEGTTNLALNYSWATGNRGARIGVNGSTLRYKLVQADFDALEAKGTANTLGASYSYPLARRNDYGADVSLSYGYSALRDETISGETGNRSVHTLNLNWGSYKLLPEGWYRGMLNSSVTLTLGDTNEKNDAARAADETFRNTAGSFGHLLLSTSHLRPIAENWTLISSVRGQLADSNLDSSARMSLGGPSGVRAFPVSEATGDEAVLTNLQLSRTLDERSTLGFFVDWGRVRINQSGAFAGDITPNMYNLSGGGISYSYQFGTNISFNLIGATPFTNNPAANLEGENADGRDNGPRLWLNFGASF